MLSGTGVFVLMEANTEISVKEGKYWSIYLNQGKYWYVRLSVDKYWSVCFNERGGVSIEMFAFNGGKY